MPTTRSQFFYINSSGVPVAEDVSVQRATWASDAPAQQIIDPNARVGSQPRADGWFDQIPDGAEHNFSFRRLSLMLSDIETRGFLSWSALTDYDPPALVWGSDGGLYYALAASDHTAPKDPITEPTYWGKVSVPHSLIGQILIVPFDVPPPGTLVCNGALYLKADYQALYNAIGVSYGGTPDVNFRVPDYQGYFLRGLAPDNSVDRGSDVTITGSVTAGLTTVTSPSTILDLEIGSVLSAVSGTGSVPVGSTIADFNFQASAVIPPVIESITLSAPATVTGTVTLTFTNRFDRGDGSGGNIVGAKQQDNTGRHSHAAPYQPAGVTTGVLNREATYVTNPTIAAGTYYADLDKGVYDTMAADTRGANISVLFCIRYD